MSGLFLFPSYSHGRMNVGVSILLFAWLCVGLNVVLPNHGGSGLSLPQNLMTWSVMAIIALLSIGYPNKQNTDVTRITFPPGTAFFIVGVILWSLPILWSPRADWQLNALPKVLGLWGIASFYLVLLCTTSCHRLRSGWLIILVIAALMQDFFALWQWVDVDNLPGGRPYGSFQQVNVLASFLATGVVCALWLFLQNSRKTIQLLCGAALILLPATMMTLQSRAGNLGAMLALFIILVFAYRQNKQRAIVAVIFIASGVGIGYLFLHSGYFFNRNFIPVVDKGSSTFFRLYILKLTWELIKLHPLVGNGYGSFEVLFGQLAQQTPPGLESATLIYPHNEILYAWAEGGLVAVAGIVCIIAGVLQRLWGRGGAKWVGVALLTPIAIHMNLEYPLYQSATHCLTLVMLLVVSGGGIQRTEHGAKRRVVAHFCRGLWRGVAMLIPFALLMFMATGVQTQLALTRIEQRQLQPLAMNEHSAMQSLLNPYSQFERLDFDRHVALLLRFNMTHDPALLTQYRTWAEAYIQVHNNPDVYHSLMMIYRAWGEPSAQTLCLKAKAMWLDDLRFNCRF